MEFEIKLVAPDVNVLDSIAFAFPQGTEKAMSARYFDTASGALSARKWTLRLRQEGEKKVLTFKTKGEGYARGEWEYETDTTDGCGKILLSLGAPQELESLLQAPLHEVCGAEFTRRATLVQYGESTLELSCDSGRLYKGEKSQIICEAEVELKEGREEDAVAFAKELATRFALKEESKSKFVRAINL
ncbi:MAG: CYTH domain-containing protein [Oscillospiraceae bacterium]|nr:CYTH domain-containing protein [Oscillospiraceae bacterium]